MMIAGRTWTDSELERLAYLRYKIPCDSQVRKHFINFTPKQYNKATKYIDEHPKYKKWLR